VNDRVLGIVGDGPRLAYVLNALSLQAEALHGLRIVVVHASDSPGAGWVHHPDLPGELTMNRQAGELSFGPDDSCRGWEGLAARAVTMKDWLNRLDYPTSFPDDFPPRAVHGRVLRVASSRSLEALSTHVPVRLVRGFAARVAISAGARLTISGDFPTESVDECLLLTGHGDRPDFYELLDEQPGPSVPRTVIGAGATGLDLAICMALKRDPDAIPVQHLSRSGLGFWPRPRRAADAQLKGLQTPHLDRAENATALESRTLLADVVAEILFSYGQLVGLREDAFELSHTAASLVSSSQLGTFSLKQELVPYANTAGAMRLLSDAPWDAVDVILGKGGALGDMEARLRDRLSAAEAGYGVHPGVTAVEHVLRDQRPLLCKLTLPGRMRDRASAFSSLVGSMNLLVNGPAPVTARTYLSLRGQGAIQTLTGNWENADIPVMASVAPFHAAGGSGPLANCLENDVARSGVEFQIGSSRHMRVAVNKEMALDGPRSEGNIFALGPSVDTGELLHASAMRPGCDHTVMREVTQWIDGLLVRTRKPKIPQRHRRTCE
jgi:hypothetical protein